MLGVRFKDTRVWIRVSLGLNLGIVGLAKLELGLGVRVKETSVRATVRVRG